MQIELLDEEILTIKSKNLFQIENECVERIH
jgi:hypothetical protein